MGRDRRENHAWKEEGMTVSERISSIESARLHGALDGRYGLKIARIGLTLVLIGGVGGLVLHASTLPQALMWGLPLTSFAIWLDGFGLFQRSVPPQSRGLASFCSMLISLAIWRQEPRFVCLASLASLVSLVLSYAMWRTWLASSLWKLGPIEIQAGKYTIKDLEQPEMTDGALDMAARAWSQGRAKDGLLSLLAYQGISRETQEQDIFALMLSWRHGYIYAAQDLGQKKKQVERLTEENKALKEVIGKKEKEIESKESWIEYYQGLNQEIAEVKNEAAEDRSAAAYWRSKCNEKEKEMNSMKSYIQGLLKKIDALESQAAKAPHKGQDQGQWQNSHQQGQGVLLLPYTPQKTKEDREGQDNALATSGGICPPRDVPSYVLEAMQIERLKEQGMSQNAAAKSLGITSGRASQIIKRAKAWKERNEKKKPAFSQRGTSEIGLSGTINHVQ